MSIAGARRKSARWLLLVRTNDGRRQALSASCRWKRHEDTWVPGLHEPPDAAEDVNWERAAFRRPRGLTERAMKVSYFETGRYVSPPDLPREWPVPPGVL